ncbi:hypothetical protein BH11MYX3_BH11MYX3_00460 [soil metagenome]
MAIVGVGSSYTDVLVDGSSDRSLALCNDIVACEVAGIRRMPEVKPPVVTACSAAPLPRVAGRAPYLLVTTEQHTGADVELDASIRGQVPSPSPDGPELTATVVRVMQLETLEECERMRATVESMDAEQHAEADEAVATFVEEQIQIARATRNTACAAVPGIAARCAKRRAADSTSCDAELSEERRKCAAGDAQIADLQDGAQRKPERPARQHRCQSR